MVTDPIADFLTRIRNAQMANHRIVEIPASNLKKRITEILYDKGYILKYKFETNQHLKNCTMPVVIFHGDQDEVIPYTSAVRLKEENTNTVTLITLSGQTHNGITDNPEYKTELKKILTSPTQ